MPGNQNKFRGAPTNSPLLKDKAPSIYPCPSKHQTSLFDQSTLIKIDVSDAIIFVIPVELLQLCKRDKDNVTIN